MAKTLVSHSIGTNNGSFGPIMHMNNLGAEILLLHTAEQKLANVLWSITPESEAMAGLHAHVEHHRATEMAPEGRTGKRSFFDDLRTIRRLDRLSLQTQSESAISVIKLLESRKH